MSASQEAEFLGRLKICAMVRNDNFENNVCIVCIHFCNLFLSQKVVDEAIVATGWDGPKICAIISQHLDGKRYMQLYYFNIRYAF